MLVMAFLMLWPADLCADGGVVRASQERSGYRITVFTSPTPLRVGSADISVMVQNAATGTALVDVPVQVLARPLGADRPATGGPATADAATNKLLRSALLDITDPGRWHVEVIVAGHDDPIRLTFEVDVAEAAPAWLDYGLWIGWPALIIALFALQQWLVHRQRLEGKPPPP